MANQTSRLAECVSVSVLRRAKSGNIGRPLPARAQRCAKKGPVWTRALSSQALPAKPHPASHHRKGIWGHSQLTAAVDVAPFVEKGLFFHCHIGQQCACASERAGCVSVISANAFSSSRSSLGSPLCSMRSKEIFPRAKSPFVSFDQGKNRIEVIERVGGGERFYFFCVRHSGLP